MNRKCFGRSLMIAAAPLLITLNGCAVQVDGTVSYSSVSGTAVYHDCTEQLHDGMTVTLTGTGDEPFSRTTYTDAHGAYTFMQVQQGSYLVCVESADSVEKQLTAAVTVTQDAAVVPPLSFTGTGSLCGTIVLDGEQDTVSGALVALAGTTFMSTTNSDGFFLFTGLPAPRTYELLVLRGSETLFLQTAQSVVKKTVSTGVQQIQKESSAESTSLIWKGSFSSSDVTELAFPGQNWAFFNETDGCSYLYDGKEWCLLAKAGTNGKNGIDGKDGANGKDGAAGKDGANGKDGAAGKDGATGKDGIGITWKGALATAPDSPSLNWAYFNQTDYTSYIWDGKTWQILTKQGEDLLPPNNVQHTVAVQKENAALLTWEDPADSDVYGIIICCALYGEPAPQILSSTELPAGAIIVPKGIQSYTWSGLVAKTTYQFTFCSADYAGNRSQSSTVDCYIAENSQGTSVVLDAVTHLTASYDATAQKVFVTWVRSQSLDISSQTIYYTVNGESLSQSLSPTVESFSFPCEIDNKQHSISVSVSDNVGNKQTATTEITATAGEGTSVAALKAITTSILKIKVNTQKTATATITGTNLDSVTNQMQLKLYEDTVLLDTITHFTVATQSIKATFNIPKKVGIYTLIVSVPGTESVQTTFTVYDASSLSIISPTD